MKHWSNTETQKHWNRETEKHRNTETQKNRNTEILKHWNTETLKQLKHWNNWNTGTTETKKHWNTETLKHWKTETQKHSHGSYLKPQHQKFSMFGMKENYALCSVTLKVGKLKISLTHHLNKCCYFSLGLFLSALLQYKKHSKSIHNKPATSTQVFLTFPVSTSECWDGSQVSKLLLHASHVAFPA